MMGASGYGDQQERAFEKRAYWWKRTGSGKLLWPGQKYVLVKTYFDAMGRPPIKGLSWDRILTPNEYLVYQLNDDSKKKDLYALRARIYRQMNRQMIWLKRRGWIKE